MVLVGLGLDASAHRGVLPGGQGHRHPAGDLPWLRSRPGDAVGQAGTGRDDTRTSSAGPPSARDLNRKATERGAAAIRQDARESLDYSVRTYYTKSGITYLQRTTTLPDGVRVRGSHSVTIGEPGEIRITFYPVAVDLCHEEFDQLKNAIPFEAEKPPNAPATRRAPNQWYCRLDEQSWQGGRARLIAFVRAVEDAWREHEPKVADRAGRHDATDTWRNDMSAPPYVP